jgi:hypothetical protein
MFNLRESREVVQEPSSFEARTRPCIPRNRRNMDRIDWLYRWTGSWPVGEKTNPDSGKLEQREEPPATPKQAVSLTDELRIHQESVSKGPFCFESRSFVNSLGNTFLDPVVRVFLVRSSRTLGLCRRSRGLIGIGSGVGWVSGMAGRERGDSRGATVK